MQKKRGRPNEVDEVGIHSLKVGPAEMIRAQNAPGKEEFRVNVFDEIVATYERKGIGLVRPHAVTGPSSESKLITRMMKEIGISNP